MLHSVFEVLHIFAVIAWMSGLLYLPRLFVYHVEALGEGEDGAVRYFEVMELRLSRYIMLPAALGVWFFGLGLMVYGGYGSAGWLHAKLVLVLIMSGLHVYFALCRRSLASGTCGRSARFYRIMNEVPAVLLLVILFLVVVRPF